MNDFAVKIYYFIDKDDDDHCMDLDVYLYDDLHH